MAISKQMKASATLTISDSERTVIMPRRDGPGNGGPWTRAGTSSRRSAYFADSDTSEASIAGDTSRRVLVTRSDVVNTPVIALRTGGRRILDGLRHSHGQLICSKQQQQGRVYHGREEPCSRQERAINGRDDHKEDKQATVFYGSVRFPASRVALWNRRATGSPITLTPEGAVPMLVLRQHVVDVIASVVCGAREAPRQDELQWRGMLGTAADTLQGHASSDPRVRSATSGAALEILGVGNEPTPVSGVVAAPRHGRGQPHGLKQGRGLPLSGALSVDVEENGGCWHSGGGSSTRLSEDHYRALLLHRVEAMKRAKSSDPAIFTPLRLYCSLKRRGLGASSLWGDGSSSVPRSGGVRSTHHDQASAEEVVQATLSLRGEMIVPAVGVRLTPIPPLALLHTAMYQSLLARGAEDKPQSGFLTLNEGRRAVLLSDTDPRSLRAPVVGVWISGRAGDFNTVGGSPSSPRSHPYTFPACLRFLLGGGGGGRGGRSKAAASAEAFLVLQLHGGVNGGSPTFYEACAVCSEGKGSIAAAKAPKLDASFPGFEQLDFSADVDVNVESEMDANQDAGGGERSSGGAKGRANRVVVIGRLRSVSNPLFAGPFRRALEGSPGRQRATQPPAHQLPTPAPTQHPPRPSRSSSRREATPEVRGARWHVRRYATASSDGGENIDPMARVERLRTPASSMSPQAEPVMTAGFGSIPPSRRRQQGPPGTDDPAGSRNESNAVALESGTCTPYRASTTKISAGVTDTDAQSLFPSVWSSGSAIDRSEPLVRVEGKRSNRENRAVSPLATAASRADPTIAEVSPTARRNEEDAADSSHAREGKTPTSASLAVTAASTGGAGRQSVRQQHLETAEEQELTCVVGDTCGLSPSEKRRHDNDSDTPTQSTATAGGQRGADVLHARSSVVEASSSPSQPSLPPMTTAQAAVQPHGFDLETLDPAARDFLLAQQRQLSILEEQLRLLQATMQDRRTQGQQHYQQQYPFRQPVEPSIFSVSSGGPLLLVRASTELGYSPWGGGGEKNEDPTSPKHRSAGVTQTPAADARVTLVESSTNTSLVWRAQPPAEGKEDCDVSRLAEGNSTSTPPSSARSAGSESAEVGDPASRGRRTSRDEASGAAENRTSASPRNAKHTTGVPVKPDLVDAPSQGQTTQRDRAVDASRRWNRGYDVRSVSSGSEAAEDELEAPSLGRQLPGVDADPPRTNSVRGAGLSRVAQTAAVVKLSSPSEDGKAPGMAPKEENAGDGHGGKENRCKSGEARKHSASISEGTRDFDKANGDCESAAEDEGRNGSDLRRHWPQMRPVLLERRKGASVGPVAIADLVVVPRIEFGQLTEDELESDLDEGETIWRIESKYLKGGGVNRVSGRRGSIGSWR